MSQTFQLTEGIILRAIPFKDNDQILSIFTSDVGLIKIFYKGGRTKRTKRHSLCEPLTQVEIVYLERKGEIFGCHEINSVESFSFLRKELIFLEVACDLLQVIQKSQFVGKAAPQLYALLCFYLKKIPQTVDPWILAASFRLKLLKHEGLIALPFTCNECQHLLEEEAFIFNSEAWCICHQFIGSQHWKSIDLIFLYRLANCQSYREIGLDSITPELYNKINALFEAFIWK